jgi:hypothetical protein
MTDFVECDTCRAKTGTPQLCNGCLANRDTISNLQAWQEKAFDAHPNIDLDIETLEKVDAN